MITGADSALTQQSTVVQAVVCENFTLHLLAEEHPVSWRPMFVKPFEIKLTWCIAYICMQPLDLAHSL